MLPAVRAMTTMVREAKGVAEARPLPGSEYPVSQEEREAILAAFREKWNALESGALKAGTEVSPRSDSADLTGNPTISVMGGGMRANGKPNGKGPNGSGGGS
jgi:hypothetical protein